jgi:hypothetical protein
MVSKAIAELDAWLVRAEEVLQEQRDQSISPSLSWNQSREEWTVSLEEFEQGLEQLLQSLCERPGRWILIAEDQRRPTRFWQALAFEDGSLVTEVVSNRFLVGDERWTPWGEDRLLGLGWNPPEQPKRPNWLVVESTTTPQIGVVAERAVATLRAIFGVDNDDLLKVILFPSPHRGDTPATAEYAESKADERDVTDSGLLTASPLVEMSDSRWRAL